VLYGRATPTAVSATTGFNVGGTIGWNFLLGSFVLSPGAYLGVANVGATTAAFDWSPRIMAGLAF
jgi:hypothetical protein